MVKFVTFPRTFWRANAMKCFVVRKLNQLLRCPRRSAQSRLRVFVIKPGFPKKSRLYTQSLLYLSSSKTYSRQAFLGSWEIKNCESANYYATKLRASLYSSKFWTLFQGFTFDKSLFTPLFPLTLLKMPMHKGAMPPLSSSTPLLCRTRKRVVDQIF